MLWDSTEAYRAMYYNLPEERAASLEAHDEILNAIRQGEIGALILALNTHRDRALAVLKELLKPVRVPGRHPGTEDEARLRTDSYDRQRTRHRVGLATTGPSEYTGFVVTFRPDSASYPGFPFPLQSGPASA